MVLLSLGEIPRQTIPTRDLSTFYRACRARPLLCGKGGFFTRTLTPLEILHLRCHTTCDLERGGTLWFLSGEGPAPPLLPGLDFIAKTDTLASPYFNQARRSTRGRGQDYQCPVVPGITFFTFCNPGARTVPESRHLVVAAL